MTHPTAPGPAPSGAVGCVICGGECAGFTPAPHPIEYPFLPGGVMAANDDTVPAPGRMFDSDGVLRYRKGQPVPKAELKDLQERPAPGEERETAEPEPAPKPTAKKTAAKKAAGKSTSRGPARETR